MSNQIILKKSSVAAKVPLTTDLAYGELALNYADGKLYFKNSSNTVTSFGSNSATETLSNKTLQSPSITGTVTFNGSTGIAGQFLKSTGTGLEWGYPTTLGNSAGNSRLEFSADVNNNPLLNIIMNNVSVATFGGGQITFNVPLSMNGNTITGLGAPLTNTDAVTKAYADGATSSGSYPKGDYGGLDAVAAYDAFGVSIVPIITYDNMTPVGIFLTADFGSSLT
jgi:hypothetical protein